MTRRHPSEQLIAEATRPPHGHADPFGARMGMWLFLFTEVLLFGTLFLVYAVYLETYTREFNRGSTTLAVPVGAVNTLILLTSSLTMALAVAALHRARRRLSMALLAATIALAAAFLVIKAFEWADKFDHHIYPGSEIFAEAATGYELFFNLYFVMTGLHALHVAVGAGVIAAAILLVARSADPQRRVALLENTGLYWHLVDMVWIYLFPLFYLIG
ncbi:MAG: cytochrome c oxidase subunit 3 family protein [Phycisphaerae bacterium]|nr:cytochrome c oxidase subunit 3 family protein [Phycisphaerae bacterium]